MIRGKIYPPELPETKWLFVNGMPEHLTIDDAGELVRKDGKPMQTINLGETIRKLRVKSK